MMGTFSYVNQALTTGIEPMEHNFIYSTFGKMLTNGGFLKSGMSISGAMKRQLMNVTTIGSCKFIDRKEVSLVVPEKML